MGEHGCASGEPSATRRSRCRRAPPHRRTRRARSPGKARHRPQCHAASPSAARHVLPPFASMSVPPRWRGGCGSRGRPPRRPWRAGRASPTATPPPAPELHRVADRDGAADVRRQQPRDGEGHRPSWGRRGGDGWLNSPNRRASRAGTTWTPSPWPRNHDLAKIPRSVNAVVGNDLRGRERLVDRLRRHREQPKVGHRRIHVVLVVDDPLGCVIRRLHVPDAGILRIVQVDRAQHGAQVDAPRAAPPASAAGRWRSRRSRRPPSRAGAEQPGPNRSLRVPSRSARIARLTCRESTSRIRGYL